MRSRHYIEEIDVASLERPVPAPVAVVVLALVAVAAVLLVQRVASHKPDYQAATQEPAPAKIAHR